MDVGFPVSPQTTCAGPRPMIDECIGLLSPTDVQLLVSPASTLSVRNELARDLARVNVNGGAAAIRQ